MEHVAGITGPRRRCKADYKGVKSIKITMYFSSRRCVPDAAFPFPANERQAGGKRRKTRKSSVTRSKGVEERRGGCRGTKKGDQSRGGGKRTKSGGYRVYKCSACREMKGAMRSRTQIHLPARMLKNNEKKSDDEIGCRE